MLKKIALSIFTVVCSLSLAACNNANEETGASSDSDTNQNSTSQTTQSSSQEEATMVDETFVAVIVRVEEEITVAKESNGSDLYRMNIEADKIVNEAGTAVAAADLTPGTVVAITFNGIVGRSYPAYIANYSKIEVSDRQDEETLSEAEKTLAVFGAVDGTTQSQ